MRYLKGFLIWFRDVYVVLMVVPLWLWSVYYRVIPAPHIDWIDKNWNLLCLLVFTHGALALWQYAEKVVKARDEHTVSSWQTANVWLLSLALFLTGIGAILKSNGVFWGEGLLAFGVIGIPVFVLWLLGYSAYERKDRQQQKEPPEVYQSSMGPEIVPRSGGDKTS